MKIFSYSTDPTFYTKLAFFLSQIFLGKTAADTCMRAEDFKRGCNQDGCFYMEGESLNTSQIAIASKPINFTGTEIWEDPTQLKSKDRTVGEIACHYKAESGAAFYMFSGENATPSSSNWQRNKENNRLECKSETNDVNNCPYRFLKR